MTFYQVDINILKINSHHVDETFLILFTRFRRFNSNFLIKLALYEVIKYTGILEKNTHF